MDVQGFACSRCSATRGVTLAAEVSMVGGLYTSELRALAHADDEARAFELLSEALDLRITTLQSEWALEMVAGAIDRGHTLHYELMEGEVLIGVARLDPNRRQVTHKHSPRPELQRLDAVTGTGPGENIVRRLIFGLATSSETPPDELRYALTNGVAAGYLGLRVRRLGRATTPPESAPKPEGER